jgi:NH3-dependent NAD+ synthetase
MGWGAKGGDQRTDLGKRNNQAKTQVQTLQELLTITQWKEFVPEVGGHS